MAAKTAIIPTREQNYPEWYQQVIRKADLAELSPVRGCMIFKPWGYALWENMQRILDADFKGEGVENVYCPLFIPLSLLEKEAEHVEGFAKECAVVTHHRLAVEDGKLVPAGELEEPLVVRPTSEALIGDMFAKWVQSYRDLPIMINQWANIVRWEMRTRMFLRTAEFLWQEGHTVHATAEEAHDRSKTMLDVYANFVTDVLAIPVIKGEKTASERFPGAQNTYCIEAMMQDGKALQAGTSHYFGQNFAKTFDIKYLGENEQEQFAWTTSWGVSTRMIGGMIMVHGDDDGLMVPPRVAPQHVIIIPAIHDDDTKADIMAYCEQVKSGIEKQFYHGAPVRVKIDTRDERTGNKVWNWIKKGAPIRLEIGKRELADHKVFVGMRHKAHKDKTAVTLDEFCSQVTTHLDEIQQALLSRANDFMKQHQKTVSSKDEFYQFFNDKNSKGFVSCFYVDDKDIEASIKADLNVTARCVPFSNDTGTCIFSGKPGAKLTVFAKAY